MYKLVKAYFKPTVDMCSVVANARKCGRYSGVKSFFISSFNGIEELPEDMFEDMPALIRVNVSGNKLKSVPKSTWGKIWDQLEEVYLESMYYLPTLL